MRDNFSKLTKDILAARVGYRCSNPDCSRPTSGPRADPEKAVNLGIASHITAAAPGGPRYDPHLTPQQRKSMSNAIWLCQLCAKLIDSDEERYKIEVLWHWKEQAEALAHAQLQRPASPYDFSAIPGFLEFLEILTLYVDNAIEETLDIHGFLHWIDANPDVGISPELQRVLALLKINPISGNNILHALSRRRSISRQPDDELARIQDRLVQLYKNLIEDQVSEREQHRIRTSARLLEIASRNLVGTGVHADISNAFKNPSTGTLSFRWRIGDQSPNLMLVELVGGVLESRISTILNSNTFFSHEIRGSVHVAPPEFRANAACE